MPFARSSLKIVLSALLGAGPLPGALLSASVVVAGISRAQAEQSKLGNLAAFRTIVAESKSLLEKNDANAAKVRLKDLETSWDEAEAGLKPRAAADWHTLDKAIDRALIAVRSASPDIAASRVAVDEVLSTIDRFTDRP